MDETLAIQNPWWEGRPLKKSVERKEALYALKQRVKNNRVCMLLGGRRVGKTTLIHQYIGELLNTGVEPKNICYILLDSNAFEKISIFELIRKYRQIHNLKRDENVYLFLDEIQYKDNWEQYIKNIYDTEPNINVMLSGSASFKIHTKTSFLTGRFSILYLYPLSFKEFLQFKNIQISLSEKYIYENELNEYLLKGGYPEYLLTEDYQYFPNLVDSIIYKDFVEYFNIKNLNIVKDLLKLIADRTGSHTSLSKLGKILSIAKETVRDYVFALKETFTIYELQRYATSRNERIYFPKKYYINDNGLLFNLSGKFNKGQVAEQTLFDFLYKKYNESLYFYYYDGIEIDFLIKDADGIQLIESKYINDVEEFDSKLLVKAMETLKVSKAVVITESLENTIEFSNKSIEYIPLWKYILSL